ncbi:MAG: hypothetical protein HC838_18185 [Spirulinaceae cyanobacterium RM2_2_10]|nr:hypothetical protein [Spirulinaceae cyanobacterium RM2_2_10]
MQSQDLIRGDRSYYDLIAAKNIPAPITFKPATPAPETTAEAASAPEVATLTRNVTPLLAQLEADLQRIRSRVLPLPATAAAPLVNFRPAPLAARSALSPSPLRFDPRETSASPPTIFEVPVDPNFPGLRPASVVFQPPNLSFLKTAAFERDRHGLRLALFNPPSKNEVLANQFLAGNPLFDGTLNVVLANVTASPLVPSTALPIADWRSLSDSLMLLSGTEQSFTALAEPVAFDLATDDWLNLSETEPLTLLQVPTVLDSEPVLDLELSLPVEPVSGQSPLSTVFQPYLAPVRSLEEE